MTMPNWNELASQLPSDEYRLPVPLHVLLGEATDVASFFSHYWATRWDRGRIVRLGLETAGEQRLPVTTGQEILSLVGEVQKAQVAYVMATGRVSDDLIGRARFVLDEIMATLEWLFDDGVQDENDLHLAAVVSEHRDDPSTADALALALEDFAALAEPHRAEMAGLGGFNVACIDEARLLASKLRSQVNVPFRTSDAARAALSRRNRLLQLLGQRVARVRAAARFVFRQSPEIARQVGSAYERRRRAEARQAARERAGQVTQPACEPLT